MGATSKPDGGFARIRAQAPWNDRYGNILVGNKVAYDLLVTPREVEEFDTLALAQVLDVSPDFIREKMAEYKKNRRRIGWQLPSSA